MMLSMIVVLLSCSIVATWAQTDGIRPVDNNEGGTCETLQVPLCSGMGYDSVYFPNFRNHETQGEAAAELNDFRPLIESECSPLVGQFFCSFYLPFCFSSGSSPAVRLMPCRSLCMETRAACEPALVENSNYTWPTFMDCSLDTFPCGDTTCFGPPCSEDNATTSMQFTTTREIEVCVLQSKSPLTSEIPQSYPCGMCIHELFMK